jgi:hypothetical protein
MKCDACGVENLYGSKTCKSCAAVLGPAGSGAASPPPPTLFAPLPALDAGQKQSEPVEQLMRTGHREPDQVGASPSGPQGLDFIPYTGNVQFNHFIRGLRLALDFKGARDVRAFGTSPCFRC